MTARRAKRGDLHHLRTKYKAVAECDFGEGDGVTSYRCPWMFIPHPWDTDADCRKAAKDHVMTYPGHEVVVTVRDLTRYYLPDALVAELTAVPDPGERDDAPADPSGIQED